MITITVKIHVQTDGEVTLDRAEAQKREKQKE